LCQSSVLCPLQYDFGHWNFGADEPSRSARSIQLEGIRLDTYSKVHLDSNVHISLGPS